MSDEQEVYRVWFDDPAGCRRCVDVPRSSGIASLREGIWVDADWRPAFTGAIHWIPPSRFVIVSKLDKLETIDG
jgi:hypothetical protein